MEPGGFFTEFLFLPSFPGFGRPLRSATPSLSTSRPGVVSPSFSLMDFSARFSLTPTSIETFFVNGIFDTLHRLDLCRVPLVSVSYFLPFLEFFAVFPDGLFGSFFFNTNIDRNVFRQRNHRYTTSTRFVPSFTGFVTGFFCFFFSFFAVFADLLLVFFKRTSTASISIHHIK